MHMSTRHTCWSTLKHRFHMFALHVSTEFLGRRHQHCFNIWETPGIFLTFRSDFRVIAEVKGDLIEAATMRSLGETELSQVCSRGWYGMLWDGEATCRGSGGPQLFDSCPCWFAIEVILRLQSLQSDAIRHCFLVLSQPFPASPLLAENCTWSTDRKLIIAPCFW